MRKISLLILSLVLISLVGFLFWNDIVDIYYKLSLNLPVVGKEITDFLTKEAEKVIFEPTPLRSESENPQSFLTKEGVIKWTNNQRVKYGLLPLTENQKLDAMAQAKVDDMFLEQYFAHISPKGKGVGDLAKNFGYEFIVIGENLALGDYKDDTALVQAWMDSIGHRENILNNRYQEIGVAVKKGVFEGRTTWLAVQHFGLPLSVCPSPDEKTKSRIETNQATIDNLQETLNTLRNEIMNIERKRNPLYSQKIEEYNTLVNQYNNLVEETKTLISQYNIEVNKFNQCVTAGT
jgi:hypothetical protein